MEIKPHRPFLLTNGAMVEMGSEGLFWCCNWEDKDLLPEQGPERTAFVLSHIPTDKEST
jgi:hypothetical protein